MNIAKKLTEALRPKRQTSGYDTVAVVKRIEGNTAWVGIEGGVDETPVKMSINVNPGDNVNVRVAGGKAWITGNNTAPPADGKSTIYYSSANPPANPNEADTWFNPNEDNAIYKFSSGSWEKQELGEKAIKDLSVTNAKIKDLNAEKITAGFIDTARLKVNEIITAGSIAVIGDVSDAESRAEKKATSFIGTIQNYSGICVFNETTAGTTPTTFINLDPSAGSPAMNIVIGGKKKASYGDKTVFFGSSGNTLYQALSIEPLFSSTPDGGTYSGGTIQFSAYDTSRSGPRIEGARYLSGSIYKTGIAAYSDTFTIYGTVEAGGFKGLPLRGGTLSPDNEVTVQNQTWKNCGHFTVPAGTWTITVLLRFAENATGRRALMLAESASDVASGSSLNLSAIAVDNAVSGTRTYLRLTYVTRLDEPFTYYIGAWQNSGASLATAVRVRWAGIEEL